MYAEINLLGGKGGNFKCEINGGYVTIWKCSDKVACQFGARDKVEYVASRVANEENWWDSKHKAVITACDNLAKALKEMTLP